MPDPVHRIETHVEARPDELWTLGQTIRYVRGRDVAWTRLAPPFTAGHVPTLEGQKALWALWRDIAAGTISSPEDIRARGIVNPSPLTPVTREAIFDLWRELAAGTVRPIEDHREVHPSRWSLEARLILNFQEKQGARRPATLGRSSPRLSASWANCGSSPPNSRESSRAGRLFRWRSSLRQWANPRKRTALRRPPKRTRRTQYQPDQKCSRGDRGYRKPQRLCCEFTPNAVGRTAMTSC
jgi:hypothetical protein